MRRSSSAPFRSISLSVFLFALFAPSPPVDCLARKLREDPSVNLLTTNNSAAPSLDRHVRVRRWYVPIVRESEFEAISPVEKESGEESSAQDFKYTHFPESSPRAESDYAELSPALVNAQRRHLPGHRTSYAGDALERLPVRRAIARSYPWHSTDPRRAFDYDMLMPRSRRAGDKSIKQPRVHIYFGSVGKRR